jgi:hypothetical protein
VGVALVPRVRLTGRASRYLQILVDLGHLDDEAFGQVVLSLHVANPQRGPAIADVDAIRSAAAWVLAERAGDDGPEGVLQEDWALLFS